MRKIPRRRFLQMAMATSLTAAASRRVPGANERVRLGVIGTGDRGRSVMGAFLKDPSVEVVALCDIWDENLAKAREKLPARPADFGEHLEYSALLDRKDVDAVLIATPDHWHAAIAIAACQAGKDVYVEKPLTYAPEEGLPIVKAARAHDRVMQVGMQQRSGAHYLKAKAEYFDTGRIGKVTLVRTWWHGNSFHLRKAPFTEKPPGLNWERFVGPRPPRPWDAQQFCNWRAYLDFGGGQITDLFTHWIDVVQWFMKEDLPQSAVAAGGVYHYRDGRTAPDTINVLLEYPGQWTATFEATLAPGARGAGIEFLGTEGRLFITRSGYTFTPRVTASLEGPSKEGPPEEGKAQGDMTVAHVEDFLACLRNRRLPSGDVLAGHRSALASHLGNIAYLQKRRIVLDPGSL